MVPLIVIGAVALAPVLLALIFRTHAFYLFASICIGFFLQFALSDDVDLAFATIIRGSNSMVIARLALLALPIILTLFVLRKTVGKSLLFQLLPLIFSGLFLAAITLPLLPPGTEQAVYDSAYGSNIRGAQDLVISAAVVSNLVLMWTLFKHHGKNKHH
jgi:hypothetical protein